MQKSMTPPSPESQRLADVERWMFDEALPLWASAGQDQPGLGFVERLGFDGKAAPVPFKRMRVQARQIYVFSHASLLGWRGPALQAARNGFEFATRYGWLDGGGWALELGSEGGVVDPTLALYEQSFMLFALGWYARATGDGMAIDWAHRTLDAVRAQLSLAHSPGFRSEPRKEDVLEQNPHMHFLEAMLSLYETSGDERFLEEAHGVVVLLEKHMFQHDKGILPEFFDAAWRPVAGTIVEPGHHFEWVWLLAQYRRLSGRDVSGMARRLFIFAEEYGVSRETKLVHDALLPDGSPHLRDHRSWCQAEALKAHIAISDHGGDIDEARINKIVGGILDLYLATFPRGLWKDHLTRDLHLKSTHVPASSLYHLFLAFSEFRRWASSRD